jgi:hypothetical protein
MWLSNRLPTGCSCSFIPHASSTSGVPRQHSVLHPLLTWSLVIFTGVVSKCHRMPSAGSTQAAVRRSEQRPGHHALVHDLGTDLPYAAARQYMNVLPVQRMQLLQNTSHAERHARRHSKQLPQFHRISVGLYYT